MKFKPKSLLVFSIILLASHFLNPTTLRAAHNSEQVQHRVRWIHDLHTGAGRIISHKRWTRPRSLNSSLMRTRSIPAVIIEDQSPPAVELQEAEGPDLLEIAEFLRQKSVPIDMNQLAEGTLVDPSDRFTKNTHQLKDEIRTLISSGPSSNRIDIVFMGDGYTAKDRDRFFNDINRLVDDMFLGPTFKSYLPAFNVHAVFRPSDESGIGKDIPGKTAYGLYREGDTLRAIFPGDTAALRDSCEQAPDCDYPVVIANDPWYGGLGGEFAISTSSISSGSVVLRHELGHNFGRVGEEYDGGGYFGANHSDDVGSLGWRDWIVGSTPRLREEPMVARFLGWPWHDFKDGLYEAKFKTGAPNSKTIIRFSASGFGSTEELGQASLEVRLDNLPLKFKIPMTDDRTFIDIEVPKGFASGDHRLEFAATPNPLNSPRGQWLSSLTVHEYALDFPTEPSVVSAFPVFDRFRSTTGYRPTNESCLMRNMMNEQFCSVCQENNWLKFLDRIQLIDSASAHRDQTGIISAEVSVLELGQFRHLGTGPIGERIEIRWFADGQEVTEFRDLNRWEANSGIEAKGIEVEVKLLTPEIKKDQFDRTIQRIVVPIR